MKSWQLSAQLLNGLYLVLWIIIIIWGGMAKWDFWRQRQRILNVLFFNRLYPIQCSLLDGCIGLPASCQLVFLLHILSLIIQEKASDAFTFLFLPFPPLGTKACHKRDCKLILVTIYQNKINFGCILFPMLEWKGIHTFVLKNHLL